MGADLFFRDCKSSPVFYRIPGILISGISFALGAPQFWQKLASGALTFPHEHFQGVSGLTAPPFDIFASILPNVCDMSERVRSVSRVFLEAICIMFSDISMYIAHIMWLITAETIPDSANNQYILYPSIKDATNTINKPTTHTQKLTITATLFTFVHLSFIFESSMLIDF